MAQSSSVPSKTFATNADFICTVRSVRKSSERKRSERNIRSLKNILYRYLEENWTYSYLDKLDSFVKTINSRVNRTIKLAPNKVTKKTFRGLYR